MSFWLALLKRGGGKGKGKQHPQPETMITYDPNVLATHFNGASMHKGWRNAHRARHGIK